MHRKRKRRRITQKRKHSVSLSEDEDKEDEEEEESDTDDELVSEIDDAVSSWTATQLKSLLSQLKSLRSIDGKAVFEHISSTGKKADIQGRIRDMVDKMFHDEAVAANKRVGHTSLRTRIAEGEFDFSGFKSRVREHNRLVESQSARRGTSSKKVMSASLLSRLNACDKKQIVAALRGMLSQQPNGQALATALERMLPKPNTSATRR